MIKYIAFNTKTVHLLRALQLYFIDIELKQLSALQSIA